MVRRVYIETFGCQMNEVDSARMVALLGKENHRPAESLSDADLVLLNTCSIREKADQKIYSALGHLRRWKKGREGRLVAVGGGRAQQGGQARICRVWYSSSPSGQILAQDSYVAGLGVCDVVLLGQNVISDGKKEGEIPF